MDNIGKIKGLNKMQAMLPALCLEVVTSPQAAVWKVPQTPVVTSSQEYEAFSAVTGQDFPIFSIF